MGKGACRNGNAARSARLQHYSRSWNLGVWELGIGVQQQGTWQEVVAVECVLRKRTCNSSWPSRSFCKLSGCPPSKGDARPANVPSTPNQTYKHEGWLGYGHWLSSE